jgi:hypothetical protein
MNPDQPGIDFDRFELDAQGEKDGQFVIACPIFSLSGTFSITPPGLKL